jgi:hypothetical protein
MAQPIIQTTNKSTVFKPQATQTYISLLYTEDMSKQMLFCLATRQIFSYFTQKPRQNGHPFIRISAVIFLILHGNLVKTVNVLLGSEQSFSLLYTEDTSKQIIDISLLILYTKTSSKRSPFYYRISAVFFFTVHRRPVKTEDRYFLTLHRNLVKTVTVLLQDLSNLFPYFTQKTCHNG